MKVNAATLSGDGGDGPKPVETAEGGCECVSVEGNLCIAVLSKFRYLMEIRPCLRAQTTPQRENLSDASNLSSDCGDCRLFSCSIPLKVCFRFASPKKTKGEIFTNIFLRFTAKSRTRKHQRGTNIFVCSRVQEKGGYFSLFFKSKEGKICRARQIVGKRKDFV
jgi:hypothetical protein